MRTVVYLPETAVDFEHIYEHYAYERGVVEVADRIDLAIRNAIHEYLAEFPGIGRAFKIKGVRLRGLLIMDSHWAMYSYDDEFVYIHHIIAAKELTTGHDVESE